jgi:ribosomal protein S18 acetylase RimI-like enzyme
MALEPVNTAEIGFEIRAMQIADFTEVEQLWRKTEGIGLTESDTRSNIALYLERNPGMSFIARQNRKLAGAVLCGHDGRRGYLHHLAVARDHRGRGIGKSLLNHCITQLARIGILKCNIFVYANNAQGEAFWIHHGWEKRSDLCMMQCAVRHRLDLMAKSDV